MSGYKPDNLPLLTWDELLAAMRKKARSAEGWVKHLEDGGRAERKVQALRECIRKLEAET